MGSQGNFRDGKEGSSGVLAMLYNNLKLGMSVEVRGIPPLVSLPVAVIKYSGNSNLEGKAYFVSQSQITVYHIRKSKRQKLEGVGHIITKTRRDQRINVLEYSVSSLLFSPGSTW